LSAALSIRVNAGACLLHSAAPGRVATESTVLPGPACDLAGVRAMIAEHARLHATSVGLVWKVVGPSDTANSVANCLRSLGQAVEKIIARPGSFDAQHFKAEGRLRISVDADRAPPLALPRRLKVLVVDDSSSMRGLLKKMIEAESDMEVVAAAALPSETEALIQQHKPDVITLDIHMPEEDGLSLLKRIFPKYRIPTIMVTAISLSEGPMVLQALESGAVDYVQKPEFSEIESLSITLREKIRVASKATTGNCVAPFSASRAEASAAMDPAALIVMGASTGGTEALRSVLMGLPAQIPPILIVQHIPPAFSKAFADRLNQLCPFEVIEGSEPGLEILPNRVIVAAGGTQMGVRRTGSSLRLTVDPSAEAVNRHRPSVDFLFHSAKNLHAGPRAAVLLTGMGADGAQGMKALREAGWHTIAQDEATSVVFGMPKEAIKLGGAEHVLGLPRVAGKLSALLKK
jgi:two-component system chemotaxis response regulator CheB